MRESLHMTDSCDWYIYLHDGESNMPFTKSPESCRLWRRRFINDTSTYDSLVKKAGVCWFVPPHLWVLIWNMLKYMSCKMFYNIIMLKGSNNQIRNMIHLISGYDITGKPKRNAELKTSLHRLRRTRWLGNKPKWWLEIPTLGNWLWDTMRRANLWVQVSCHGLQRFCSKDKRISRIWLDLILL